MRTESKGVGMPAFVEPSTVFGGGVAVVAPHMDDETLGCGGLLAMIPRKEAVHVLFATDGARSPEPPRRAEAPAELGAIRRQEALAAMAVLGVPAANVHFLSFPDGLLAYHAAAFRMTLLEIVRKLGMAHLFVPFRYDWHPDHITINRVAATAVRDRALDARLVEYFVYAQWRLLRAGDVRAYVLPDYLVRLDVGDMAKRKRRALECYRTQTTRYYGWQRRPILTASLLDRVCREPETFLLHEPSLGGRRVLVRGRTWIPIAHWLEPTLKRGKDRVVEWLRR